MTNPEIHDLIQKRDYDFPGFIREHQDQIDDHVQTCETCHERMIGWTSHLPRLRAKMTVHFPAEVERFEQLKKLKRGQCLPCGCEVLRTPWTREEASAKLRKALGEILHISEKAAAEIPEAMELWKFSLTARSLRRLRDKFWIPDGSRAAPEDREAEEGDTVLQLPETVGEFIDKIFTLNSGISYVQCSEHWCP